MPKRLSWISPLIIVGAFLVGLATTSITSAEATAARRCQWTYLVDHGDPEITGFPPHEPLADAQTGRGVVRSNDAELRSGGST